MKEMNAESPPVWLDWSDQSEWILAPQQARSRDSMRRILDASFAMFSAKGFDNTTMIDIADRADMSAGAVYRRFPDKESILYAIIEAYYRTRVAEFEQFAQTTLQRQETAAAVITSYVRILFSGYRNDEAIVRLLERRALVDVRIRERVADNHRQVATTFAMCLRPYKLASDAVVEEMAVRVHAIIRGTLVLLLLPDAPPPWPPFRLGDAGLEDMLTEIALTLMQPSLSG